MEIEGKEYTLHKHPTVAAVEEVMVFDEMMDLGYIDLSILKPEDMKKPTDQIVQEQGKSKPRMLAEYRAKRKLSERLRTIMICTGMREIDIQGAPLEELYEECDKIMDGTATDFFLRYNENTRRKETRTRNRFPEYAKAQDDLIATIGKLNAKDLPKESQPQIAESGSSG